AALPANAPKNVVIGYANGNVNAQSMAHIVVANLQTDGLTAAAQGRLRRPVRRNQMWTDY
ncbi:MAG: transporter substrate-binding protein, partial [Verrucomicrobiales bacterium]|nr:transporter substrate-binding protein [Verrucomicrobiales bacterium]